jgi:hypothetical protein
MSVNMPFLKGWRSTMRLQMRRIDRAGADRF